MIKLKEIMQTNIEKNLDLASSLFNRSLNQSKFILELCDNDFLKYLEYEIKVKKFHEFSFVPGDKETLNEFLEKYKL